MSVAQVTSGSTGIVRAIYAGADVIEVDVGDGFCASVYRAPGVKTVLRLDRSIQGAPYEGDVLRWAMWHCSMLYPDGLYIRERERDNGAD